MSIAAMAGGAAAAVLINGRRDGYSHRSSSYPNYWEEENRRREEHSRRVREGEAQNRRDDFQVPEDIKRLANPACPRTVRGVEDFASGILDRIQHRMVDGERIYRPDLLTPESAAEIDAARISAHAYSAVTRLENLKTSVGIRSEEDIRDEADDIKRQFPLGKAAFDSAREAEINNAARSANQASAEKRVVELQAEGKGPDYGYGFSVAFGDKITEYLGVIRSQFGDRMAADPTLDNKITAAGAEGARVHGANELSHLAKGPLSYWLSASSSSSDALIENYKGMDAKFRKQFEKAGVTVDQTLGNLIETSIQSGLRSEGQKAAEQYVEHRKYYATKDLGPKEKHISALFAAADASDKIPQGVLGYAEKRGHFEAGQEELDAVYQETGTRSFQLHRLAHPWKTNTELDGRIASIRANFVAAGDEINDQGRVAIEETLATIHDRSHPLQTAARHIGEFFHRNSIQGLPTIHR